MRPGEGYAPVVIAQARENLRNVARVRTEMLVRKVGQRYAKRQPTTAIIRTCPLPVCYHAGVRTSEPGPVQTKRVWRVEGCLENVAADPWLLLTDGTVEEEAAAVQVFRMYRERWAVEDCFKFTKDVLGGEDVHLLDCDGIRTRVALGWGAAGFLYELGVTREWPEISWLARLAGGELRPDRPPGKTLLARGLQRLLEHGATSAILADAIKRHGALPPRIAAFLGSGW